jgi:hypothetical protein
MTLSLSRGLLAFIAAGMLLLLGFLAAVVWLFFRDAQPLLSGDDVNMISVQLMELYRKKPVPTDAEIDERIRRLIEEGRIGGSVGRDGKPLDRYGTPYRVRHTVDGAVHASTATCAGPDRTFDTPDDISRSATWEASPPEKR